MCILKDKDMLKNNQVRLVVKKLKLNSLIKGFWQIKLVNKKKNLGLEFKLDGKVEKLKKSSIWI